MRPRRHTVKAGIGHRFAATAKGKPLWHTEPIYPVGVRSLSQTARQTPSQAQGGSRKIRSRRKTFRHLLRPSLPVKGRCTVPGSSFPAYQLSLCICSQSWSLTTLGLYIPDSVGTAQAETSTLWSKGYIPEKTILSQWQTALSRPIWFFLVSFLQGKEERLRKDKE